MFDGISVGDAFGWACRPASDVDADAVGDLVSGALYWDGAEGAEGYAAVHSRAGGRLIREWFGDDWFDSLGHAVDGAGDVDGHGHGDLIVGAIESGFSGPVAGNGFVRVYSGATSGVLFELSGDGSYDQPGFSVRGVGDVDGDGHPEFLFGATEDVPGQTRAGYAEVYSRGLVLTDRYCTAGTSSSGVGAMLYHSGSLSVSENDFALRALGCPPHHFGLFYYGTQAIAVPFGDGFRCVGGATFRLGIVNTGAQGSPSLALDLANPPQPAGQITAGSIWRFQLWYRDIPAGLSGFNLTDPLSARIAL